MKQKSLKLNTLIYSIRNIVNLLLPLITFPYVCRVLSVDSLGKANFAGSIVSYFLLIAGLGISGYGRLHGSRIRDDREKFDIFASEMLTINLLMTIVSYVLFLIYLCFSKKASDYTVLLLIASVNIWLTLIGQEWIFDVYEEYAYITCRSIAVQIFSVAFLFVFVKDDADLYWYAVYSLLAGSASNLFNFVRLRKMVRFHIRITRNLLVHMAPIIVLFANGLASSVYLNSDITLLGYLATDAEVGYYNAAVKIYNLMKMSLASITAVSGTRMAYLYARTSREEYYKMFRTLFFALLMLAVPATVGVYLLREPIVLIIAGEKYLYTADILSVLLLAMLLGLVAGFVCGNYTLVSGQAKKMLYATIQGAALNIILNFLLIPRYGALAAAFTTVLAEGLVLANLGYWACKDKKLFRGNELGKHMIQFVAASGIMSLICCRIRAVLSNDVLQIVVVGITGVCVYFSCLLLMRNSIVLEETGKVINTIKKMIDR